MFSVKGKEHINVDPNHINQLDHWKFWTSVKVSEMHQKTHLMAITA